MEQLAGETVTPRRSAEKNVPEEETQEYEETSDMIEGALPISIDIMNCSINSDGTVGHLYRKNII